MGMMAMIRAATVALALYYVSLVACLSLPITLQRPQNVTSLQLDLLANSSSLGEPDPPSGFNIKFISLRQVSLNPLQMYCTMMEMMAYWARQPWNGIIPGPTRMTSDRFKMQLLAKPVPQSQRSRLHYNQAVSGLYEAGVTISQQNLFYKGIVLMRQLEDTVGYLEFDVKSAVRGSFTELSEHTKSTASLSARGGEITDPLDPLLKVKYVFDGSKTLAGDIFTAFLDALANAAEHDKDDKCTEMAAISISRRFGIHIRSGDEPGSGNLTYGHVVIALIIIWEQLLSGQPDNTRPRYEGLEFDIEYAGQRVAEGYSRKMFLGPATAVS